VLGIVERFKSGLSKTRSHLADRIRSAVSGSGLTDGVLDELEEILIEADVGVQATETLLEHLDGVRAGPDKAIAIVRDELLRLVTPPSETSTDGGSSDPPTVIMIVGTNGTGKTTTIGKLAHHFHADGKRVLIAAADTFRAAATDQLAMWAEHAGADMVSHQPGADPAAVAFDAISAAKVRGADLVIVDTAGRLHTKSNLMEELKKIARVIKKHGDHLPHETLLVLDATTGQNAIVQAQQFHRTIPLTGLILTKLDGTAKGGIVAAVCQELSIPVKFIGVGEGVEDLREFDPVEFVDALFG